VKLHYWFAAIVLFTALTLLFVYVIPGDSPFAFLNYAFGFVFVTIVPGYCLVSVLFATKENKLDRVEEVVLSVALSFGIAGLVGLFLGLSPIGMDFTSITISLNAIVLGLAVVAFVRKNKEPKATQAQTVEQGSS